MTKIPVSFFKYGRRWFSGKRLNDNYEKKNFPHLFNREGNLRGQDDFYDDDDDGNDTDLDEDNVKGC